MTTVRRIVILIASVRDGRKSDRVARFFHDQVSALENCSVEVADLKEFDFPVFHERLRYMKSPPAGAEKFAGMIRDADGVIIVTPEYNGGYPAALKNAIDLLYEEWIRKPIAISTVSSGQFAGSQVITSLLFSLWKIGAWVVPAMFPVPDVEKTFDANGKPPDDMEASRLQSLTKRAATFTGELLFAIDAQRAMGK